MRERTISRRTALRAFGTTLALPLLDAMRPLTAFAGGAAAGAAGAPLRLGFLFVPNGVIPEAFFPKATGPGYELTRTLGPLAARKDDVLVLSGLALDNARAKGDGPGDHARCSASFLTTAHPKKTAGRDIRLGVSVDQALAQAIGEQTALRSLELGTDEGRLAGRCDSGYSCAYTSNVSWSSPTTPVPKLVSPRQVFERLFGSSEDRKDRAAQRERLRRRKSVLDFVLDDARRLEQRLGRADREKLGEYQSAVREVERRIERAESTQPREAPEGVAAPAGSPRGYRRQLELLMDLWVLALRCDLTRTVSFMAANAGSNHSFREVGVSEGHHHLSHHKGDKTAIAKIEQIDRFYIERLAYLLERLHETEEGDGRLLDNTLICYGSGIQDGNRHSHHDLPILLCGRGGGVLSGRHLRYPKHTPLANLYVSLLGKAGAPAERFGDSTGALAGLDSLRHASF